VVVSTGSYQRWWDLMVLIEPFYLGHLLGIIGASWIAIFTPIYVYLKRKTPQRSKALLQIHVFGNFSAFLLLSMHVWQQIGRPADFTPNFGTGLSLYVILSTMVVTGIIIRFQLGRRFLQTGRAIHVGLTVSFYIVLIIHILLNTGVL